MNKGDVDCFKMSHKKESFRLKDLIVDPTGSGHKNYFIGQAQVATRGRLLCVQKPQVDQTGINRVDGMQGVLNCTATRSSSVRVLQFDTCFPFRHRSSS